MESSVCNHDEPAELFFHDCPDDLRRSPAGVHALVVGIGQYMEPPRRKTKRLFQPLIGTAPAATHFAQFLLHDFHNPRGIPLRTVRLLLAPAGHQDEFLLTEGRDYRTADYRTVAQALDEWAVDCDTHPDNVALLYVAAHGLVTSTEARWAFAPEAGSVDDIYMFGINVTALKQRMAFRRARTQIFVWDLCALLDEAPDNPGSGGSAVALRPRDGEHGGEHAGAVEQITLLPRTGTRTWALNAVKGTVLSRALVGLETDELSPRLMKTAVSVDDQQKISVTPDGLRSRLPDAVRHLVPGDPGEMEAIVETEAWRVGLNLPDEMPICTLTVVWRRTLGDEWLHLTVTDGPDSVVSTSQLEARSAQAKVVAQLPLPAGRYRIAAMTASRPSTSYGIELTCDVRIDALSGWVL